MAKLKTTDLLEFLLETDPRLDIVCDEHNHVCLTHGNHEEVIVPCEVANPIDRVQVGLEAVIFRLTYYCHCRTMGVRCEDKETMWLYASMVHFLGPDRFKRLEQLVVEQFSPDPTTPAPLSDP